jgi:hypothetical protein
MLRKSKINMKSVPYFEKVCENVLNVEKSIESLKKAETV